jgi:DNA invertase Pin-like site-specific DNA recombinase
MPFVVYLRVSTQRQGQSGLGLEAQQEAVERYAAHVGTEIIATFTEVESGSQKDRPQLAAALALCRQRKAVLLIARLDRLSRSLTFVAQLLDANVEIKAADMPEANRMLLQMLAVFAEHERGLISQRTKAALAAAKARGVKLGKHGATLAAEHQAQAIAYAQTVRTSIDDARRDGATTTRALARWMNDHGVPSRSGGMWHAASVNRLLGRLR